MAKPLKAYMSIPLPSDAPWWPLKGFLKIDSILDHIASVDIASHAIPAAPLFHAIKTIGEVQTSCGPMLRVEITDYTSSQPRLMVPDTNVIAHVGWVGDEKTKKNQISSVRLWYWNERFYASAVDSLGLEYYMKKQNLLYEVKPRYADAIFKTLIA